MLSDVLANCAVNSLKGTTPLRTTFQDRLPDIFTHLRSIVDKIPGIMTRQNFTDKVRALKCPAPSPAPTVAALIWPFILPR